MAYRYLDRTSTGMFGCWIGPDNVVHPENLISVQNETVRDIPEIENPYPCALKPYDNGFVMARFERNSRLHLKGRINDLQRSQNQWMALAKAVNQIEVVLVYEPDDDVGDDNLNVAEPALFIYPEQKCELTQYLNSEGAITLA